MLGKITSVIGKVGGDIEAVDLVESGRDSIVRDISVNARDVDHGQEIVSKVKTIQGIHIINISDPTFLIHLKGKLEIKSRNPLRTRNDLSMVYTPGVGRICNAIYEDPDSVWNLTIKGNTIAVVTDGTAVLGLGDIGPEAAMPVMEGKAILFKELAGVDAWPICLSTKDPDEIVTIVKGLAPGFGGINLEDISAPRCFYIEDRLKEELDIPVFHDDQHGTAVVTLAALYNAMKVVNKQLDQLKVVMLGVGAGGTATAKILMEAGVKNILGCDRQGILHPSRDYGDNENKIWFAKNTNPSEFSGSISEAMEGADLFIGLSGPNMLTETDLKVMNKDAIVFALANPDPEIFPEEAAPYVRVMATGRSDYPNQINNALCFPGFFCGMLDVRASSVNSEMKIAAAKAIAAVVPEKEISEEYIIPSIFDKTVVPSVAQSVAAAAQRTGVARKTQR
jgi:malate dehydrogenase (oxaloacetate-decarboxylating)